MSERKLQVLTNPLWERQPSESHKAYEAFRIYRDMGRDRSLVKVGQALGLKQVRKGTTNTFTDPGGNVSVWSSRFRWVERVRAFEAYLDTILLAEQEKQMREAAASWVRRQEEVREREWALSAGLLEKVRDMLKYPVTRTTRRKVSKDGKTIWNITIEPARWDWKAAVDVLRYATSTARLSADMVTEGSRAPTPDPTSAGSSDLDAWLTDLGAGVEDDPVPTPTQD